MARDPIVLRDTKVSARNIKGFSPLSFIVICCYLFFPLLKISNLPSAKQKFGVGLMPMPDFSCADFSVA